ncbi:MULTISPECIES: hypothetical protein [unclassified Arthrobacter]|nr:MULTISPECIES: hypothetical protein [unclassified Arthrobacter]
METLTLILIAAVIVWAVIAAAICLFVAGCSRNWKAEQAEMERRHHANRV